MERSTMFNGKIHYKWSFSIAMLVYQRVNWRFDTGCSMVQHGYSMVTADSFSIFWDVFALWLSLRRYIWHPKSWSVSKLIFLAILKFLEAWSPSKTSQLEPFEPFEPESSQNRVAKLDALKWWGDPKVITHQMTCHFRVGDLWYWAAGLR